MKKLIDYIIKEPTVNSPKRGYKFPFVASEILSSEAPIIAEKFFQEAEKEERLGMVGRTLSIFDLSDSFAITALEEVDFKEDFLDKKESKPIEDPFNPQDFEFNLEIKEKVSSNIEREEYRESSLKDISLNNVKTKKNNLKEYRQEIRPGKK